MLQLCADGDSGSASLTSITEYQLKQPIYSFIVPGNHTRLSPNKMGGASSDSDDETGPHDQRLRTVGIKLHTIHSKSVSVCQQRNTVNDSCSQVNAGARDKV